MPARSETILDPNDPELLAGNVDFYCFGCGYNLRGLAGDPKRCPECFELNAISDLIVPAKAITEQLRRLEAAPTTCVAAILMLATGITGAIHLKSQDAMCSLVVMAVPAPAVWLLAARTFARSCRHRAGWKSALARFHVCGLLMFAAAFGIPLSLLWIVGSCLPSKWPVEIAESPVPLLVTGVSFAVVYFVAVQPLYRKAKSGFSDLQRQTAVEMARELHRADVRRRLRRP